MRLRALLGLLPLALAACSTAPPRLAVDMVDVEPAAGPLAATAAGAAPSTAWPSAGSCNDLARRLVAMDMDTAGSLDPAASPLGLAALGPGAPAVRSDLPIPQMQAAALAGFDCALIVGAATALPAAPDRVIDQLPMHGAYRTGTRRQRNPEHRRLESELAAARRGGTDDATILKTGDPLLDLIGSIGGGIIGGIGAAATAREVRAIEAELEAAPAFIDDPVLTPYRYTLTEVEAERRIVLPLALHDRARNIAWRTSVTLDERRRFAVAGGRHPSDAEQPHAAEATLTTAAELDAWRRAAPPLTMRAILTHLHAAEPGTPGTLAATMAALETPPSGRMAAPALAQSDAAGSRHGVATGTDDATMPTALMAAVDAILATPAPGAGPRQPAERHQPSASPDGTTGAVERGLLAVGGGGHAGFYVTTEHIVAPAAALGHSSLVAVRHPDGMRAHGLVEIVDDELGLALIYLPRRGAPLPRRMAAGAAPSIAGPSGTPSSEEGRISGVFVGDPETGITRWIDAVTLERFVARLDAE
jgi:hypothetical protein